MSIFSPEFKERTEKYLEERVFSPEMQKKIENDLVLGKERFPDIISCPNQSCRNPVQVHKKEECVYLVCGNCGWSKRICKTISK